MEASAPNNLHTDREVAMSTFTLTAATHNGEPRHMAFADLLEALDSVGAVVFGASGQRVAGRYQHRVNFTGVRYTKVHALAVDHGFIASIGKEG